MEQAMKGGSEMDVDPQFASEGQNACEVERATERGTWFAEKAEARRALQAKMRSEFPHLYTHPLQPWPWRNPVPDPDSPAPLPNIFTGQIWLSPCLTMSIGENLVRDGRYAEAREHFFGERSPAADIIRSLGHPGWTARLERCLSELG